MNVITDVMPGFKYQHGYKVAFSSSIGKIELTYKTHEGQAKDDTLANAFCGDLPYDEPDRNAPTFFEAVLLDENNKPRFIAYGIVEREAIKSLYHQEADARMSAELYNWDN